MFVVFLILVIFHVVVSGFAPLSTTTTQYQTHHQEAGIGSHLIRKLAHESSDTNHHRNAMTGAHQTSNLASKVRSVNYHICRKCNYACKFCFHSQKNQVLLLEKENTGLKGELKDATNLVVMDEQFWSFIARHEDCDCIIPEPNTLMQNSYLLLDEKMCFMNSSNGSKVAGDSILRVGVENALKGVDFDEKAFIARGGVYKWTRLNN